MKAYIRSISRKAWFLIWTSVVYLMLVPLLFQWLTFEDALLLAQTIFVFVLCIPLLFPSIGRRVGLFKSHPKTLKEKTERKLLYAEAELSGIRRYISDNIRVSRRNMK